MGQNLNPSFDFANYDANTLESVLNKYGIALTPEEAQKIQAILERPPTLAECVLWGIQGSEHCSYKSSKRHLKQLPTQGPHVILGAEEDAGIICIATDEEGNDYGLAISHESHNHPSQVEPFGGAATGVGGNVRDVNCMGAEVIGSADSLRFGSIKNHQTHWIYEGVIEGIASYGNAIGVPNMTGDVFFDPSFNDNCLVTAVTLGLLPKGRLLRSKAPDNAAGYDLILVGQPTDKSGFGGASFSSQELDEENEDKQSAVQQPNAFLGRVLLKANYLLFNKLYEQGYINQVGFKDLGAGGIGCASIELADNAGLGAEVWLDRVPLAFDHLLPIVKLCSETQERYMWACPPELTEMILNHYNQVVGLPSISENAGASVVGRLTEDGQYRVHDGEQLIINAPARQICEGIQYNRDHRPPKQPQAENTALTLDEPGQTALRLLTHENAASRECLYENYDKQVQGRTVIERGEADAGLYALFNDFHSPETLRYCAVGLAVASNPNYGRIDPYWTAVNAVVEAYFKVISVGCVPQAITDCLCFGSPEKPEHMHQFVQSVQGIKDTCEHLTLINYEDHPLPVVAGNVSFYNETQGRAVSASPLISCIGRMSNYRKALTSGLKKPESAIVLLSPPDSELGGSLLYRSHGAASTRIPQPDLSEVRRQAQAILEAIDQGMVNSCKVNERGGFALALAKMCIQGGRGCKVNTELLSPAPQLFNEHPTLICEIKRDKINNFQALMESYDVNYHTLGYVSSDSKIMINDIDISVNEAQNAWKDGLRDKVR